MKWGYLMLICAVAFVLITVNNFIHDHLKGGKDVKRNNKKTGSR